MEDLMMEEGVAYMEGVWEEIGLDDLKRAKATRLIERNERLV